MNSNQRFSIGELSKATGVKVVTIRYYEHVNLMPVPPRTRGNYRVYRREHLHRLQFVRRCRDLGFTLDQLRDLLYLSVQSRMRCSGIDRITENHLLHMADYLWSQARLQSVQMQASAPTGCEPCLEICPSN